MAEKEKELATSRLLDLLRSQETVKPSGPEQTLVEDKSLKDKAKDSEVEKPPKEKLSPQKPALESAETTVPEESENSPAKILVSKQSSVVKKTPFEGEIVHPVEDNEPIPVESPPVKPKSVENTQDLLQALGVKKAEKITPPEINTEVKEVQPAEIRNELISKSPIKETVSTPLAAQSQSQQAAGRIIDQIRSQELGTKTAGDDHPADEFDHTLLAPIIKLKEGPKKVSFFGHLFEKLDQDTCEVTLYRGETVLYFMILKKTKNGTFINKFQKFLLPFDTGNGSIDNMDDLIGHVINNEIEKLDHPKIYLAYISDGVTTTTRKFDTPKLKQKEFLELIQWTGKKNLPFDPGKANLDWLIYPGDKKAANKQVLISTCNKDTLQEELKAFDSLDVHVRYVSTIPALLWKLFVNNYPDRSEDCLILMHIGEKGSIVSLVKNNQLLYSRNIAIGIEKFIKSIQQRIVEGNEAIQIDETMARKILFDYGFPEKTSGLVPGTKIKLYKISIFMRPVLEKLSSEINRSLSYFKKENPNLEWSDILFSGMGAGYPNIISMLGINLGLDVGILHPNRTLNFQPRDDNIIQDKELADYALNFALSLSKNPKINVLPAKRKSEFKFIFLSNLMVYLNAVLIPLFILSLGISGFRSNSLQDQIGSINQDWSVFSEELNEYNGMADDISIWKSYGKYLANDRIYSTNQLTMLKLLASLVPKSIKLTRVEFKRLLTNPNQYSAGIGIDPTTNKILISGFVRADPSIADIEYTNFVMRLKGLKEFQKVESEWDQSNESSDKLFFKMKLDF